MTVIKGNNPIHDEWRAEMADMRDLISRNIEQMTDKKIAPIKAKDPEFMKRYHHAIKERLNAIAQSERWIKASKLPHLVRIKRALVRTTLPFFIVVENNERQYWYGFDDLDEAVLFMLKYA